MSNLEEIFGREQKDAPKQKSTPEGDRPKTYSIPATLKPKPAPDAMMEIFDYFWSVSPEIRERARENEKNYRDPALRFQRVYVKKGAPEGDYFMDEYKALEAWGDDGYELVFRQKMPLSDDGKSQPLGRVATKEEAHDLIKAESVRRRENSQKKK